MHSINTFPYIFFKVILHISPPMSLLNFPSLMVNDHIPAALMTCCLCIVSSPLLCHPSPHWHMIPSSHHFLCLPYNIADGFTFSLLWILSSHLFHPVPLQMSCPPSPIATNSLTSWNIIIIDIPTELQTFILTNPQMRLFFYWHTSTNKIINSLTSLK